MRHTSHTIQTLLNDERLEAFIDGSPYTLLCAYHTRQHGFSNAVYIQDHGHDVVIEQDGKAAIMGLFSTKAQELPKLFDYLESTVSRNEDFRYCLTSDLQAYLVQATAQGNRYPILEQKLQPEKASFLGSVMARVRRQPTLAEPLRSQLTAHSVPVVHLKTTAHSPDFAQGHSFSHSSPFRNVENESPTITPAKGLPEGWEWVEYSDGSGGLQSPKGELYFACSSHSGLSSDRIAYYETLDDPVRTFRGSKEDFKQYAVSIVNTAYLKRKDALEHTIHSAAIRKTEQSSFRDDKLKEPAPER